MSIKITKEAREDRETRPLTIYKNIEGQFPNITIPSGFKQKMLK